MLLSVLFLIVCIVHWNHQTTKIGSLPVLVNVYLLYNIKRHQNINENQNTNILTLNCLCCTALREQLEDF